MLSAGEYPRIRLHTNFRPTAEEAARLVRLCVEDTESLCEKEEMCEPADAWEAWNEMFEDDDFREAVYQAINRPCSRTLREIKAITDAAHISDDQGLSGPLMLGIMNYKYEEDRANEPLWSDESVRTFVTSREVYIPNDAADAGLDPRDKFTNVGYFLAILLMFINISSNKRYHFRDTIEMYKPPRNEENGEDEENDDDLVNAQNDYNSNPIIDGDSDNDDETPDDDE